MTGEFKGERDGSWVWKETTPPIPPTSGELYRDKALRGVETPSWVHAALELIPEGWRPTPAAIRANPIRSASVFDKPGIGNPVA